MIRPLQTSVGLALLAAALAARPAAAAEVLTLDQALRTARAHQPALDLARGALINAEGQADTARAPLLPQLNGAGTYSRGTTNPYCTPASGMPCPSTFRGPTFDTTALW